MVVVLNPVEGDQINDPLPEPFNVVPIPEHTVTSEPAFTAGLA